MSDVLAAYDDAPVSARAHVRLRWRTCPLEAVAALVPTQGRVLEIGCGHGLLSLLLALDQPGREVAGIDPDEAKIAVAQRAARRTSARVSFAVGHAAALPTGPWDAIVVADVLYLLDREEQRRVVETSLASLRPGGSLVIKEMASRPRWKAAWNHAQEVAAVRLLRITEGSRLTFVPDAALPRWITDAGATVVTDSRIDRGYLHPHRLVVGRVAPASG